ncbi:putative dolichol-P-glucose synthetase [Phocaeicola salanitronis DSM 18170]|uniref:Putative dolichol-P-glucose synthetase n=1 Tax=Phocaeicola salanitronis (strain DSM 18170 / JCM 13657 / CCUG 60908 / BL78) TaxID=667015 RepID=F0R070_PHOSB|nr:lysylphosphatidylglycerol synthase transmembrane domain-containing protein [Phocaeicola salanitronis]ADY36196.1 putative dolichol-P-glucose synthetase [Phocaeicola salanitronis DSM 18170]
MERTDIKKWINKVFQITLPLILGAAILVWTYHGFDFGQVRQVLTEGMDYGWMSFSLVFGVLAHLFRGWRWNLALYPLGEYPKASNSVYAIFVSYAANLVVPRIGEVSRCGILSKFDNVSFSKSLGTVVSERLIDSVCVLLITGVTLVLQSGIFARFFRITGTDGAFFLHLFTSTNFYITVACIVAALVFLVWMIRNLAVFARVKGLIQNMWIGCMSIRKVHRPWLYIVYTAAIWACYFLHFYLTFYSFAFSASLGWMAGLVLFVVGSIAVIVPTPNGAGPWHFAVITMMMMYGVSKEDAGIFALLVHGIQTFLLILLGIYGLVALPLTNKHKN